jgi:hypothetical protein
MWGTLLPDLAPPNDPVGVRRILKEQVKRLRTCPSARKDMLIRSWQPSNSPTTTCTRSHQKSPGARKRDNPHRRNAAQTRVTRGHSAPTARNRHGSARAGGRFNGSVH